VLLACVPLFTFVLALAQRQEQFRWEGLAGATLAVAGIAVVFNSGLETGVPLRSMLAILAGAVCWAEALIVRQRLASRASRGDERGRDGGRNGDPAGPERALR
jgi:drug/metabolite transporter (DMT)-like permease